MLKKILYSILFIAFGNLSAGNFLPVVECRGQKWAVFPIIENQEKLEASHFFNLSAEGGDVMQLKSALDCEVDLPSLVAQIQNKKIELETFKCSIQCPRDGSCLCLALISLESLFWSKIAENEKGKTRHDVEVFLMTADFDLVKRFVAQMEELGEVSFVEFIFVGRDWFFKSFRERAFSAVSASYQKISDEVLPQQGVCNFSRLGVFAGQAPELLSWATSPTASAGAWSGHLDVRQGFGLGPSADARNIAFGPPLWHAGRGGFPPEKSRRIGGGFGDALAAARSVPSPHVSTSKVTPAFRNESCPACITNFSDMSPDVDLVKCEKCQKAWCAMAAKVGSICCGQKLGNKITLKVGKIGQGKDSGCGQPEESPGMQADEGDTVCELVSGVRGALRDFKIRKIDDNALQCFVFQLQVAVEGNPSAFGRAWDDARTTLAEAQAFLIEQSGLDGGIGAAEDVTEAASDAPTEALVCQDAIPNVEAQTPSPAPAANSWVQVVSGRSPARGGRTGGRVPVTPRPANPVAGRGDSGQFIF